MKISSLLLLLLFALPALAKDTYCQIALSKRNECRTACDTFFIHEYTYAMFLDLNKSLWNNSHLPGCDQATKGLDLELRKIHPFVGTTYRADKTYPIYQNLKLGECLRIPAFISTTVYKDVGEAYVHRAGPGASLFQFEGRTGRDIDHFSNFPGEGEVLFPRGTLFKLLDRGPNFFHFSQVTPDQCLRPLKH